MIDCWFLPGIIPIDGHIPTLSDPQFPKFLTTGPMARRAEDLPLLMSVLAGENRHMLNLDTPVNMKDMKVSYPEFPHHHHQLSSKYS